MPQPNPNKINDLELAVRTIDDMLPDMPTKGLQKWEAILQSALTKVKVELTNTYLHTCKICFFQEYGYRDELPSSWYKKGSAEICFQHEYDKAEQLLKDAGYDEDAFFPPEIPTSSIEALKVTMDNLPPPKDETEQTYDDLLAEL
jgi:hypothetical protein